MFRESSVTLRLSKVRCVDEFERYIPWPPGTSGHLQRGSDPYIWPVVFAVDGDGMRLGRGEDGFPLLGQVSARATDGNPGNLGVAEVHAGDEITIPADVGTFSWLSPHLMLPEPCDPLAPNGAPGAVGVVVALFNHNDLPDDAVEAGYEAFRHTVGRALTELLAGTPAAELEGVELSEEVEEAFARMVEENVRAAIIDALSTWDLLLRADTADVIKRLAEAGKDLAWWPGWVLGGGFGLLAGLAKEIKEFVVGKPRDDVMVGHAHQFFLIRELRHAIGGSPVRLVLRTEWAFGKDSLKGVHHWEIEGHAAAGSPWARDSLIPVPTDPRVLEDSGDRPGVPARLAALDREAHEDPGLRRWTDVLRANMPAIRLVTAASQEVRRDVDALAREVELLAGDRGRPIPDSLVDTARRIVEAAQEATPRPGRQHLMRLHRALGAIRGKTPDHALRELSEHPPPMLPRRG